MDKRMWWVAPVAVFVVWLIWGNQPAAPMSLTDQAFAPTAYEPYAHWWHQRSTAYQRSYPASVGPACLEGALASEEGALSTTLPYEVSCAP